MTRKLTLQGPTTLLLFGGLMLLTALAIAELGVRAIYAYAFWRTEQAPLVYERVYWAVPPWVANTSVMYQDPGLGLWMRPNVARTYINLFGPIGRLSDVGNLFDTLFPSLPEWASSRPIWHLETNSSGLRGPEVPSAPSPNLFRIVVLGDSWTVGINVENELTFTSRLEAILSERQSAARDPRPVEVLNFGVIGGGIETGIRLLPQVLALKPNLVVIAYAQNDEAQARNPQARPARSSRSEPITLSSLLRESELYKLYSWWSTPGEDRIEATLLDELTKNSAIPMNEPGRDCPNPRIETSPYRVSLANLVAGLKSAGVEPLLLYNNVPDFRSHCTLVAMESVREEQHLHLIDSSKIIERLQSDIEQDHEKEMDLVPSAQEIVAPAGAIALVLRVDMSTVSPGKRPYVMGNAKQLGEFTPNYVGLYDDGSNGDQRAGDGVWSRRFQFSRPQILTYAFTDGTEEGQWTGLENYRLRAFALRQAQRGRTVYAPIAKFGIQTLRSDSSHPDALGHLAIATAIADAVRKVESFQTRHKEANE